MLSDRAILEKDDRPVMIPFSLSKADPEVFYEQLALHQQFLDDHKNIQIHDVPMARLNHTEAEINGDSKTLNELLTLNSKIIRVNRFEKEAKLNLSVKESDYFGVTKWLDSILAQFKEYHPKRVYGSPVVRFVSDVGSVMSDTKSKFSSKFKVSSGSTYDPSVSASVRTRRNAWISGPPLELFFEAGKGHTANEEEFPMLPGHDSRSVGDQSSGYSGTGGYGGQSAAGKSGKSSLTQGTAPSTTMSQSLEELVKAAVAATTAKMAEEFKVLKEENERIKADFRELQASISELPAQITEGAMQAFTGPTSPIAEMRTEMTEMRTAMFEFMRSVKESMPGRSQSTSTGPQNYGDQTDSATSPPRKMPRSAEQSADSPLAISATDGVGDL